MSSDTFSKFGKHDHDIHSQEIYEATQRLETKVIPDFAKYWIFKNSNDLFHSDSSLCEELDELIAELHFWGINVRYLLILHKFFAGENYLQHMVQPIITSYDVIIRWQWKSLREH